MPGKLSLLQLSSLRFIARRRWQSWLTLVGIMLGVCMVVAVDLANSSARRAFALSLESMSGNTTHQIIGGPGGIDESVYVRLRRELGIRRSAPLVTGSLQVKGHRFRLIGSDPLSDAAIDRHALVLGRGPVSDLLRGPGAVVLSNRSAERLELNVGESFTVHFAGRETDVTLAGVFAAENAAASDGLLFADIAVAQRLLQRWGKLDGIHLILDATDHRRLSEWLPPDLKLVESRARNHSLQQMSEAFHINLTAMSLLAMLVAALLIYNTMTLAVLQRRQTLGVYRALGVSRREVFALILGESAVLAVTGSAAGIVLGLLLGQFLVHLVTRTISDLYFSLHVSAFLLDPWSLVKGFALGVVVTLASATLPAWEANRTVPAAVQQRSQLEERWQRQLPALALLGLAMLALGLFMVSVEGSLVQGFLALTMMVLGFCLMVPAAVGALTQAILMVISVSPYQVIRVTVRGISSGISRTGLAVAALTVAISVTVGVGVMVGSFRHTVGVWLEQSMRGDVYISSTDRGNSDALSMLKLQLAEADWIDRVSSSRLSSVESEFGPIPLMTVSRSGIDMPIKKAMANAETLFLSGKGVLISEPLAYHRRLGVGDEISLHTHDGPRQFPVVGIFFDYISTQGMVLMHDDLYGNWWNDGGISALTVYADGPPPESIVNTIQDIIGSRHEQFQVTSNRDIRDAAMRIFDRTFAITDVLRLLAVIVAFVSVLSALIALQLERTREFGILRATGMTPGQIRAMVLAQTLFLGLFAGLLAIPLGLLMADVLINVINRRAFGWSMQQIMPPTVLLQAMVLALGSALLAGIYPAHRAASISPSVALREE